MKKNKRSKFWLLSFYKEVCDGAWAKIVFWVLTIGTVLDVVACPTLLFSEAYPLWIKIIAFVLYTALIAVVAITVSTIAETFSYFCEEENK